METQVKRAWERFVGYGQLPAGTIRDVVTQSWRRSASLDVGFSRSQAPVLGEGELHRRRLNSSEMISAAVPVLERSRRFLADARSMLIVTDADGLIVATEGDARVIDAGRDNHLELGGDWNEQKIGTNAIGTALVEKTAVQIHGSEHYCEGVQRWTCAAVPVFNPANRRLMGVVDVSGRVESFNPQSMALAVSVGSEIEAAFARRLSQEHEILLRQFLTKRAVWLNEDMIVLDRYGQVVHATRKDGLDAQLAESGMRDVLQSRPVSEWREPFRQQQPNAELELVQHDGAGIGAIVLMRGRGRKIAAKSQSFVASADNAVSFADILGESAALREAKDRAVQLAQAGLHVLIEGETGTGKELFARAIHHAANEGGGPFVPVNCGGIARELVASELFGYAGGSFTGADARGRRGKIVAADGGTLCLDEIGEMPMELQTYLLRALEDGVVYPVGSQEGTAVRLSLVSMTNRSLHAEVTAGRFRSDLFYRIAVASVRIPPLRERNGDAVLLAEHFAERAARRMSKALPIFAPAALDAIGRYDWPGNVRQLRNIIETTVALSRDGHIGLENLPLEIQQARLVERAASDAGGLRQVEEAAMREAIRLCDGNLTEAAKRLGIARSTLYVRMERYTKSR